MTLASINDDDDDLNDLGWSPNKTSKKTGESRWTVNNHLRLGHYRAKKSGRRTLIIPDSVREYWATLPDATYAPPRQRSQTTQTKT